jgi:hypothetical protein
MGRKLLDPIAEVTSMDSQSGRVAMLLHRIVLNEGDQVISLDAEGKVYATPPKHAFSQRLMKSYSDCVVGQYKPGASAVHIREDLVATWNDQRSST